jgi:hypothetical protein
VADQYMDYAMSYRNSVWVVEWGPLPY